MYSSKRGEADAAVANIECRVDIAEEDIADNPEFCRWRNEQQVVVKRGNHVPLPMLSSAARPPRQEEEPEESWPTLKVSGSMVNFFEPNVMLVEVEKEQGTASMISLVRRCV